MCSGWHLHPFFCTPRWTLGWGLNLCLSWSASSLLWVVCHHLCFSDLFGDVAPSFLEFPSFSIPGILTHACCWVMKTRLFRLINTFQCKIPTVWVEVCFASFQWSTSNLQNTTWCSEEAPMTAWSSVFASDMWKIPMSEFNFSFFLQSSITVIHHRSRTETRHLFLNNLKHLHPFRAKMFQDVELKQSRANKQTSTPLGSVTAGLVTRMTG